MREAKFQKLDGKRTAKRGHIVIQDNADAGTKIVQTALELLKHRHVTVVTDDTDILIIFCTISHK